MSSNLTVVRARGGHVCATWNNVILQIWSGPMCLDSLAAGREAGDAIEREHGPRLATLVWLPAGSMPLPGETLRQRAAADLRATAYRIAATATVVESTGFAASAYRAAHTTVNLLSRTRIPSQVVSDVGAGVEFVAETLGSPPGWAETLTTAAHQARTHL